MYKRIANNFIGRNKEIGIFINWLQDPNAPWILYFYDAIEEKEKKGGVGKTWLLRKCAAIVEEKYPERAVITIDFSNVQDHDGFTIARRVAEGVQAKYPAWSPTFFTQAIEQYSIPEYRNITAPESQNVVDIFLRSKLFAALAADLRCLDERLAYMEKSLLLCFDTFEIIAPNPTTAVLGPMQTFPDNYHFEHIGVIIAGRNPPDWVHPNWADRAHEVQCVPIPPFSFEEVRQFLKKNTAFVDCSLEHVRNLYERTGGRPILLGLAIDIVNYDAMTLEELLEIPPISFENFLIKNVADLDNPINWVILFMAHIHHRFTASLLNELLKRSTLIDSVQDINLQKIFEALRKLNFVRSSEEGNFMLHDEMRRLVTTHWWSVHDVEHEFRNELSRFVISFYDQAIGQAHNDRQRQIYIIEKLYHQLFLDRDEGVRAFQHHFQQAIRLWNSPFAHLLLLEAQKFEGSISLAQQNELKLAYTQMKAIEEEATVARHTMYEQLARPRRTDLQQEKTKLPKSSTILKIFYSYADEDRELVEQLQMHLAVLRQQHLITEWHRGKLVPGEDIANQIKHLDTAHLIVLCISPNYVASAYTYTEMMHALERYRTEKVTVIPLLLRATGNWEDAPFSNLQALPRNSKAVTSWTNSDMAFAEIAQEIKIVIKLLSRT